MDYHCDVVSPGTEYQPVVTWFGLLPLPERENYADHTSKLTTCVIVIQSNLEDFGEIDDCQNDQMECC